MGCKRRVGFISGGLLAMGLSLKGILALAEMDSLAYQRVPAVKQCRNAEEDLDRFLEPLRKKGPQEILERYNQDEEFRERYDSLSREYRRLHEQEGVSEEMDGIERRRWYSIGLAGLLCLGIFSITLGGVRKEKREYLQTR